MPVTIEEVSVETMPAATPPATDARNASAAAGGTGERLQPRDLPRHLAKLRDRDERVHAH